MPTWSGFGTQSSSTVMLAVCCPPPPPLPAGDDAGELPQAATMAAAGSRAAAAITRARARFIALVLPSSGVLARLRRLWRGPGSLASEDHEVVRLGAHGTAIRSSKIGRAHV